ncbi:hypothetical protein GGI21_004502, partial [Coemansia aciculifera]
MAVSPSLFQTLPTLIVRKVVEYLEGRSSNSFGADIDRHNKGKAVLAPLLSLNRRWCAAALASICDNCSVKFDYASEAICIAYPAWPTDAPKQRVRKYHLVKRIIVSVPLWKEICNGKFCKVITRPEYEGAVSLSATTLELRLSKEVVQAWISVSRPSLASTPASASTPALAPAPVFTIEQVASFACSVRSLTPAATGVTIYYESVNNSSANANELYNTLLTELYRVGTTRMEVYTGTDQPTLFNMIMSTGLTCIVQGAGMDCAPFISLAYYNSRTLQRLVVKLDTEDDWRALLYNGTKYIAVFECLESLTMHVSDTSYTATWAAIENAAPFPVLSISDISGGYPFDDDVLFRGNGHTMKTLRLPFCALARDALGRFNALKRKGAGRLNAVYIGDVSDVSDAFVARLAVVPIKQQIHSILEVSAALSIGEDTANVHIYHAIVVAPKASVLQRLALGQWSLYVAGVIIIASVLPSLVSLACDLQEPQLTAMTSPDSKSPSNLHTKHYPLSDNLREIR